MHSMCIDSPRQTLTGRRVLGLSPTSQLDNVDVMQHTIMLKGCMTPLVEEYVLLLPLPPALLKPKFFSTHALSPSHSLLVALALPPTGTIRIFRKNYLSNTMDDAGEPVPTQPATPSTCHVCQGLFDMKSPRGCVGERPPRPGYVETNQFIYMYLHHANMAALSASAAGGCRCCWLLHSTLPNLEAPKRKWGARFFFALV